MDITFLLITVIFVVLGLVFLLAIGAAFAFGHQYLGDRKIKLQEKLVEAGITFDGEAQDENYGLMWLGQYKGLPVEVLPNDSEGAPGLSFRFPLKGQPRALVSLTNLKMIGGIVGSFDKQMDATQLGEPAFDKKFALRSSPPGALPGYLRSDPSLKSLLQQIPSGLWLGTMDGYLTINPNVQGNDLQVPVGDWLSYLEIGRRLMQHLGDQPGTQSVWHHEG